MLWFWFSICRESGGKCGFAVSSDVCKISVHQTGAQEVEVNGEEEVDKEEGNMETGGEENGSVHILIVTVMQFVPCSCEVMRCSVSDCLCYYGNHDYILLGERLLVV